METAPEFETLLIERADGVATVTLNRPDRMNALTAGLKRDLDRALHDVLEPDPEVRVVVLTGAGDRAFCAGADIREKSAGPDGAANFYFEQKKTRDIFRRIEEYSKPTIAAINGVALGGGTEIALCCDFRIAADTAQLGLTELNLCIIPSGGGTQRLPRLIGMARAKELIFTAERISAARALAI